jgi:cytoskeletal protein CcmA (bactofilin family)
MRPANLSSSVVVKGEVSGSEDMTIDGRVEGRIDLPDHVLTIGPNATIQATINARVVTVYGSIIGNVSACDQLDIHPTGSLEGDVTCGRIIIQDGAHITGKVETLGPRKPRREADTEPAKLELVTVA